jgi:hypothetical protein
MQSPTLQKDNVPEGANSAGQATTYQARAREVHALVRWAVTERTRAMARGWSKVPAGNVYGHIMYLQQWLQHYPVPTPETQRRLLHDAWYRLQQVMPGTAAGKKKLEQLHALLSQA